jgi:SAM-dependent methyltransferase
VAVRDYWGATQVADLPGDVNAEQSFAALERRNRMYPGLDDLMPVDRCRGLDILDFGCGPGHDTIGFLDNGAAHVYAADISWYGLSMLRARLEAHGWLDRATLMLVGDGDWRPPRVDHVNAAGVIHHVSDPVRTLKRLSGALTRKGEIRMMVYSADSWFYRVLCGSDAETFRMASDAGAPISHAWTRDDVEAIANQAGLSSGYVGSYRTSGETEGPGLMSCWSLRRC